MGLKQIRATRWNTRLLGGLAVAVALTASISTVLVQSPESAPVILSGSDVTPVALSALPRQGQEVMVQIREGGPFRYEKDGTVFGNRERLLPGQKRGYYREYTVSTPGLSHRGAKRIVCGGEVPREPEACYYTEDHYNSFRLILQ